MRRPFALLPGLLLAVLCIAGAWLSWLNFNAALPRAQWGQALFTPDIEVIEQMLFHYSLLPRLVISLLVLSLIHI